MAGALPVVVRRHHREQRQEARPLATAEGAQPPRIPREVRREDPSGGGQQEVERVGLGRQVVRTAATPQLLQPWIELGQLHHQRPEGSTLGLADPPPQRGLAAPSQAEDEGARAGLGPAVQPLEGSVHGPPVHAIQQGIAVGVVVQEGRLLEAPAPAPGLGEHARSRGRGARSAELVRARGTCRCTECPWPLQATRRLSGRRGAARRRPRPAPRSRPTRAARPRRPPRG